MDSVTVSYAELYGKNNHGDFRNYYEADKLWSAGCSSQVHHTLKEVFSDRLVLIRPHFRQRYERLHVHHPGFYPVDLLEFTPGRKDLQTYAFMGGIAADAGTNWRIGGKIDFTSANYSKRKDLRPYQLQTGLKSLSRHHVSFGPLCDRILLYFQQKSANPFQQKRSEQPLHLITHSLIKD